jgi:hypothetical protein
MNTNRSIYKVIGNRVYKTTGHSDPCNGQDMVFVREFASHDAANNWLWSNHPVQ